jgi:hypothetical protein
MYMSSFRLPKICTIWMISYLRFVCFLVQLDGSIEDLKGIICFVLDRRLFIFRTLNALVRALPGEVCFEKS